MQLDDNESALLTAARSQDPVTALEAQAQRRRTPEKKQRQEVEREQRRQEHEMCEEHQEKEDAARAANVLALADLLIEMIGDRIGEFVERMASIDISFLNASGIAAAIHARRPELCARLDNDATRATASVTVPVAGGADAAEPLRPPSLAVEQLPAEMPSSG